MTAIHLQHSRDSAGTLDRRHAAFDMLSDATDRALGALREWRRRSRERAQLAGLDERMLRDIGLSHGEAEFLANKPFWKE
jgi:uncharacterized protein YjiS (DUF1127 family)